MTDRVVVGVRPWYPRFLREWDWFSVPVAAERLAALRIGTGLILLLDVLATYWPYRYDYFGPGSLAEPDVFVDLFSPPRWNWSLIRSFPSIFTPDTICMVWALAALALTIGVFPRIAAVVSWAMAVSVINYETYLHNSGDLIRQHLLFFLMLTPCGAAWSITKPRGLPPGARAAVYPWAFRLMFLELIVIYFLNGFYKAVFSDSWFAGTTLHYVLHTPGWSRWSPPFDIPLFASRGLTYFVLAWELSFPIMVLIKPMRFWALLIGAAFHLGTFFNLEIGPFGLYALCYYLPLLPWERWFAPAHTLESPPCALV